LDKLDEIIHYKGIAFVKLNPHFIVNFDKLDDKSIVYIGSKYNLHDVVYHNRFYFIITDKHNKQFFFQQYEKVNRSKLNVKLTKRMNNSKISLFSMLVGTLLFLGLTVIDDTEHNDASINSIRKMLKAGAINCYVNNKKLSIVEWEEFILKDSQELLEYRSSEHGNIPILESHHSICDAFEATEQYISESEIILSNIEYHAIAVLNEATLVATILKEEAIWNTHNLKPNFVKSENNLTDAFPIYAGTNYKLYYVMISSKLFMIISDINDNLVFKQEVLFNYFSRLLKFVNIKNYGLYEKLVIMLLKLGFEVEINISIDILPILNDFIHSSVIEQTGLNRYRLVVTNSFSIIESYTKCNNKDLFEVINIEESLSKGVK